MNDSLRSNSDTRTGTVIGILFWVVVIAIGLYFYTKEDFADVFLDISTRNERISGTVSFEGIPVTTGVVHVSVSDGKTKRYLFGTTQDIDAKGRFSVDGPSILGGDDLCRPLRISAEFRGSLRKPQKADSKQGSDLIGTGEPVSGEASLYLNWPAPIGERFLWVGGVGIAALFVIQFILFTGDMRQYKARWLFILMYFFTFGSLMLPVGFCVLVSQNPNMVSTMEVSPIGLVRAKAKGLADPQWLINIGGIVVDEGASSSGERKEASTSPAPDPQKQQREPTQISESSKRNCAAAEEGFGKHLMIVGGLAVPFYVVLLAMFGAGINMTLKVPDIQRTFDSFPRDCISSFFKNPVLGVGRMIQGRAEPPNVKQRSTVSDVRRELIENYMYLISAPFLAIAMYYLLQVLAQQVTEPVLVIMAFATGLISKAVISRIIKYAEERLPGETSGAERALTLSEAEKQLETEEAAKAVIAAKARLTEAEAAAKAQSDILAIQIQAEEAARTAKEASKRQEDAEEAAKKAAAQAQLADAAAEALEAQQDETAEADVKAAAAAAQEAKARLAEAEAAAKVAAEDAKVRLAEAEAAAKAVGDIRVTQTQVEEAAKAVEDAKVRLAEAKTAAKAAEEAKVHQAEAEPVPKATAKASEVPAAGNDGLPNSQ